VQEQEQFDAYMRTTPWVAVPFNELKLRKKVMTIYHAATLPRFVLLSPSGKARRLLSLFFFCFVIVVRLFSIQVLTDDEKWIFVDPVGAKFPWQGPSDAICAIQ
jgi:hypothetical protein